ncbi:MAG: FAD-dependent oxidoreductase [Burkholderiaceae bacterium]
MKRLLLAGTGHAHLGVLRALAAAPLARTEVVLVTPQARQLHSPLLPGWVAGQYTLEQCAIALPALLQRAGVTLRLGHVERVDLDNRLVHVLTAAGCEPMAPLPFDLLSIDTGPVVDDRAIVGSAEFGIPLQPLESFVAVWPRLQVQLAADRLQGGAASTVSVVGGGSEAVEFALAIAWRARTAQIPLRVQWVTGQEGMLPAAVPALRRRLQALLPRCGVRAIEDDAVRLERGTVQLAGGGQLVSDVTLVMSGAAAAWARLSGLGVDGRGYIGTNALLQSVSHPFVFAAGHCASMLDHPRPRLAAFAVRAGPPLAENLRRALAGRPLRPYAPPQHVFEALATGPRHAVGSWGSLAFEGAWVWRWKDRRDRAYVARHGGKPTRRSGP